MNACRSKPQDRETVHTMQMDLEERSSFTIQSVHTNIAHVKLPGVVRLQVGPPELKCKAAPL